jgi:hypothetical protein
MITRRHLLAGFAGLGAASLLVGASTALEFIDFTGSELDSLVASGKP